MKAGRGDENKARGFSAIEMLAVLVVLGILTGIAAPGFSSWLSNYRLRNAARDLYSNFQLAKLSAIKQNSSCAVGFDVGVSPGRYFVCANPGANGNWDGPTFMGGDDSVMNEVDLSSYGENITFGSGNATTDIPGAGVPPGDPITYASPHHIAIFSPTGMILNSGVAGSYVYLSNNRGSSYAVGTPGAAGAIVLRRWNGASWD